MEGTRVVFVPSAAVVDAVFGHDVEAGDTLARAGDVPARVFFGLADFLLFFRPCSTTLAAFDSL